MQMAGIAPGHFCYCGGESPEVVPAKAGTTERARFSPYRFRV
jgi:hypothetical protein